MVLKNKMYKTTAIALAIISVFGANLQYVSAYDQINAPQVLSQYIDGNYELNTKLLNASDTSKDSMANTYLKSSSIEIINGKMQMKMIFTSGNLIKEVNPTVNGSTTETTVTLDETTNERTVTFEVPSIDADIKLGVKINPFGEMIVNATCIVETSFKTEPDKVEDDDSITDEGNTEDNNTGEENPGGNIEDDNTGDSNIGDNNQGEESTGGNTGNNDSNGNTSGGTTDSEINDNELKNGYYQIKNIVKIDNATGYAMVRNLLNETTNMEVKDGKTYITFEMSGYSMMGSIKLKVDGKTVNHTQTDLGNDKVKFVVEVPSLESKVTMSMYVTPMSSTVEFGVELNQSTLKYISSNEEPTLPEQSVDSNNSNNNSSSNSSSSNETIEEDKTANEVSEDTTVVGKLYTIKNQVIHSNATGQQMARKYLNSTSKIEEINGKYYATFTFTGQDLMKDHKIYINGSRVSHSVVAKTGDSVSIRFALPSLDAKIKVELFVIPMSRTIDFEVKLLEDTLTFVKEFDAGSSTLPQTGSLLSTELMMGTGGMITAVGFLVGKRKRK